MNSLRLVVIIASLLFLKHIAHGQIENNAGTVCFLDSIGAPTIICTMSDLDMNGSYAKLPSVESGGTQPEKLCDGTNGGSQGEADNIIWYAFQAETTELDMDIFYRACSVSSDWNGVQVGIFTDCTFTETIACHTDKGASSPINLSSSDLILGKVYYLYIDGYNNSVCQYSIRLNKKPSEPYTLKGKQAVIHNEDLSNNTFCTGIRTEFISSELKSSQYNWKLTNVDNSEVLLDQDTDKDTLKYTLTTPGKYRLELYGFNPCDTSDIGTLDFTVGNISDEIFEPIQICYDCIGNDLFTLDPKCVLSGSFSDQNPNNDSIVGWHESTMMGNIEGVTTVTNTIQLSNGCQYVQKIDITASEKNPTVYRDSIVCNLPIYVDGVTYNEGDVLKRTNPWTGENGCHEYVHYKLSEYKIEGFVNTSCDENGGVIVEYVINPGSSLTYDKLFIEWFDKNGAPLEDGQYFRGAAKDTEYTVHVSLRDGTTGCTKKLPFDTKDLSPKVPQIQTEITYCSNQDSVKIGVPAVGDNKYVWSLTPTNLGFITYPNTDTIVVLRPKTDFTFMVYAEDKCDGKSDPVTGTVKFIEAPIALFEAPESVCVGQPFTVINKSQSGLAFRWLYGGADHISGNTQSVETPLVFQMNQEGVLDLSLIASTEECESRPFIQSVNVVSKPEAPTVSCDNSIANQLTFSWPGQTSMKLVKLEGVDDIISKAEVDLLNNKIVISNLVSPDEVSFKIIFEYGADCGELSTTVSCVPVICLDDDTIEVAAAESEVCLYDDTEPIALSVKNHQGGEWYYNETLPGVFDPKKYGVGKHIVSYRYTNNNCTLSKELVINVYPAPTINPTIEYPTCVSDATPAEVSLNPGGNGNVKLYIDEVLTENIVVSLMPGTYQLKAVSTDGCVVEKQLLVEDVSQNAYNIEGPLDITPQDKPLYSIVKNAAKSLKEIKWYVDDELTCTDTESCQVEAKIKNGVLKVCMKALTEDNCPIEVCLDVRVSSPVFFNTPTAFSPNGDNINDVFTITSRSGDINVNYLNIYDRYGNKMCALKDFVIGDTPYIIWDGRKGHAEAQPGVYMYIMEYKDSEGKVERKTHPLTLLR